MIMGSVEPLVAVGLVTGRTKRVCEDDIPKDISIDVGKVLY